MASDSKKGQQMWGGRFAAQPSDIMQSINASIDVDKRMVREDVAGSRAHADMLAEQGYTAQMKVAKPGIDFKKVEEEIKPGKPTSRAPLFTQRPQSGPSVPTGSVGFRQVQSPYQVPSYLMSSAQYNEQISKMLGGLLARSIRSNPIKYLV